MPKVWTRIRGEELKVKEKEFLVIDLETTSLLVEEARIRVFGAYDPYEDAWFIYRWNDESIAKVMKLFAEYKNIITFNGTKYDLPILNRHGVPTDFKHIDLYPIYKYKRTNFIRVGGFDSYSLKSLVLQLGLDKIGKEDIDYNIFKKETWTKEEQTQIIKYLKQDLTSTWKLWLHLEDKLRILGKYMSTKDAENYKYLTTNLATYTYKVICNGASIQELYDEKPMNKKYPLEYTTTPRRDSANGRIILLQFKHLFGHILMQFNLMSHNCKCCLGNEGKYHGRNIYNVKGYYCQRNQGRIEKFLKELLIKSGRDPEIKLISDIVYNNLYNVVTNGVYHSTYYPMTPTDAIGLIKQQVKLIISKFEGEGLYVLYMDNDDLFVQLKPEQTLEDLNRVKDEIMNQLKSRMSFPSETFSLEVIDELSYIQFFNKGSEKNHSFMYKGEYVYITSSGEVFSKGVTSEEISKVVAQRGNKLRNEVET